MSFSARGALHFLINSYKEAGKIKKMFHLLRRKKKTRSSIFVLQFLFFQVCSAYGEEILQQWLESFLTQPSNSQRMNSGNIFYRQTDQSKSNFSKWIIMFSSFKIIAIYK